MNTIGMIVLRMIRCSWTTTGSECIKHKESMSPLWILEPDVDRDRRSSPEGVVKQCQAEDWHWMGMERNFDLAEKQYSVAYSMSACLYRLEFTMMLLCRKCYLCIFTLSPVWCQETLLGCDTELTTLLRRVLYMERLYIIWGYRAAMLTSGFSWFGWKRLGPSIFMMALLFSNSMETTGGPKLAMRNDKRDINFRFTSKCYLLNLSTHEFVLFSRTVWLWVESPCHSPFGGHSIGCRANSGKVSMLNIPHLITKVAPALN